MNEHNMEYNSQKDILEIPEYGRNIQMLIQYAKTIEDPEYRQAFIEKIVTLMHQMHPQNRSIDDYREKLWKHVFRIADYELDVTPPSGEKPKREDKYKKPDKIDYPENAAKYRHYGHNVQKLIKKATEMEEGPVRDGFVAAIGSYMKLAYRTWNKEHYISDEIIKNDLDKLSNGKLVLAEGISLDKLGQAKRQERPKKRSDNSRGKHKSRHNKGKKKHKN